MPERSVPEPWNSFLAEIDRSLDGETHLHCLGGFVVSQVYGSKRETSDVDILPLVAARDPRLIETAAEGSDLHRRYKVYIQVVGIATLPENYEERLTEVFAGSFDNLKLFALDPYDLALSKIERNGDVDREDVRYLARTVPFDLDVLSRRYRDELRVYLGNPDREDLTINLWMEMIEEDRT